MPIDNPRIHDLAERVWELAHGDVAVAVTIMSELSGLGFAEAFEAIDAVIPLIAEPRDIR